MLLLQNHANMKGRGDTGVHGGACLHLGWFWLDIPYLADFMH